MNGIIKWVTRGEGGVKGDKRGGRGKKFQKIGYIIYGIMLKFKYNVTQKPF